jgi:hypothetical protein
VLAGGRFDTGLLLVRRLTVWWRCLLCLALLAALQFFSAFGIRASEAVLSLRRFSKS